MKLNEKETATLSYYYSHPNQLILMIILFKIKSYVRLRWKEKKTLGNIKISTV